MRYIREEPRRGLLTVLLILLAVWLPPAPVAAQPCPHNGDVTQDGELSPADALLTFQHFLRIAEPPLAPCQQEHANVHAPENAAITPADALCIFQAFLGVPSCLGGRSTRIEVREGDGAQVVVNTPQRLVVRTLDGSGNPLAAIPVTFRLIEGNGVLSATLVSTDAAGDAATTLTVGTTAGANRIEVRVEGLEGLEPVVFTVIGVADQDNARLIQVSGNNQVAAPGEVVPEPLVVRLEDQFGNPLRGELVTAAVVQGDADLLPAMAALAQARAVGPAQASPGPTVTIPTAADGTAAFRLRVGTDADAVVVEVTAPALSLFVPPVQFLTIVGVIAPVAIAIDAQGQLVVADESLGAVVRVDPARGTPTIVSGTGIVGGGPPFAFPRAIAVEGSGALVIIDGDAVVRVDPTTGDRTLLSGCAERDSQTGECTRTVGGGPPFEFPSGIAVEGSGALVVADTFAVVRVDPTTGDRTLLSGGCLEFDVEGLVCTRAAVGGGPPFAFPSGIAVEGSGALVVADAPSGAVVRVDPTTGDRTLLSGCAERDSQTGECTRTVGGGPPFEFPSGIAVEGSGANLAKISVTYRPNPNTHDTSRKVTHMAGLSGTSDK